jgi:hypothetical protein
MDETLIGTIPDKPMTNVQRRTHRNLARAEKHLIAVITWEAPVDQIEAAERRVNRWTRAWKAACRG